MTKVMEPAGNVANRAQPAQADPRPSAEAVRTITYKTDQHY